MPLVNRAPIDAAGSLLVTTATPTPAWPQLGGMTYDPVTGALAVLDAVPAANDPTVGGIRFTNLGSMYVTTTVPNPLFYVGGLPVSADGRMFFSSGAPIGSVGGWPVAGDGGIAGSGLGPVGPVPIFFAPLTSSLVPTTAGDPTFTFTRATTAYATGVAPAGNAVDGQVLLAVAANEARFHGARRASSGVWSDKYADNSPIPAANLLGYVAENAATNLCLQSQTFDDAAWAKANGTVTANNQVAPDGTLTADTFAATSAVATVTQTITTAAAAHTASLYVKRISGVGSIAFILDGTVTDIDGLINSSTWTRIPATKTLTAAAHTLSLRISTLGDSLAIWGAQVEQSSDLTSYIPTTTVAVTRNVDQLFYNCLTNIDGALATTYSECYLPVAKVGAQQVVLAWTAGGSYPQYYDVAKTFGNYSGGAPPNTSNVRTIGVVNKGATAWGGTTVSICLNGGPVATGAFTAYPSPTTIQFANAGVGNLSICGFIRNVKFYATRLTDAELITITTLPPALPSTPTAGSITDTGATLSGTATSNGVSTTVNFEYGLTTAYGTIVAALQSPLVANAINAAVSAIISGLAASTLYHWRIVATSSAGTTNSADQTFTTAGGAYVFVNSAVGYVAGGTAGTALALAAKSLTAGNHIFVHARWETSANSVTGVTDTAGNTYTPLTKLTNATGPTLSQWFYKLNAAGHASNVVTVTWNVATSFRWAESVQFSKTGAAFDVEQATGTSAASTTVTSGSFTTTAAGLILAGRSVYNQQTTSSFNQSLTWIDPGTSGIGENVLNFGSVGYRITSGALGPITVTETGNSTSNRALCIACFK